MIATHLPVLQVAVPLIAAPICVLLRRGSYAWGFTTVVCWGLLAIAALLLEQVMSGGTISYRLGGWAPPFGIEYRLDGVNAFVLLILSGTAALMMPYARQSVEREVRPERRHLFYAIFLLALTGLLGITATGDAFNLYVFLEISSLASYVLIAQGRHRRALTASYQYLIVGTIGASLILIGIGFLYAKTGTLNIADLSQRVPALGETPAVLAAFAFITVGVLIKLALFPFHVWLPNAYAYAPSVVSAFLAATATKVGAYMLLRFVFTVFGVHFAFETLPLTEVLLALSLVAVLAGSLVAVFQTDLKRLLAFSSVGQIGYLGVGIGLASVTGVTGALVHIFNHALDEGRSLPRRRRHRLSPRRDRSRRLARARPAHAVHYGGGGDRRPRPGRGSRHLRLREQVVSGAGRVRGRSLAGGALRARRLADRARLCRPRGRGRLLPPAAA